MLTSPRLLVPLLLASCWVGWPVTAHGTTIDLDRLIRCLEAREGARWASPGGALQFTKATWSEFSTDPYLRASQPDKARQIARKALFLTIQRMERDGIRPTVWLLALRWNCGYEGMKRRMREPWSYAAHVHNLYYDNDFR